MLAMIERALRCVALLCAAAAAVAVGVLAWRLGQAVDDPYAFFQAKVDAEAGEGTTATAIDPNDPMLRRRMIVIAASINERTMEHVIPRLHYLAALDAKAPIDLVVSTDGGLRDGAFAIIDTMRTITPPVNTLAVGGCYSAGTLVVAGGTGTRAATRDALLMVHANLADSDEPFAQEPREAAREHAFWRTRAHLPSDWQLDGDSSYYMTAEEARQFGIVDVVREDAPR